MAWLTEADSTRHEKVSVKKKKTTSVFQTYPTSTRRNTFMALYSLQSLPCVVFGMHAHPAVPSSLKTRSSCHLVRKPSGPRVLPCPTPNGKPGGKQVSEIHIIWGASYLLCKASHFYKKGNDGVMNAHIAIPEKDAKDTSEPSKSFS